MRIGEYVDCYRIVSLLAEGGMGSVYEAINDQIGHRVAIKQLHPTLAADPVQNLRFLHEARVVNLLSHPSLVTIHDYGTLPTGNAYIVMEYLDGETLARRLRTGRRNPLSVIQSIRFARQVATALSVAHDRGIVHRDLKPDNLMIVADPEVAGGLRIKILDFGIAKGAESTLDQTAAGVARLGNAVGTPGYIAPEQIYGSGSVSGQADVYSLGVILYEMLTGKRPFRCHSDERELLRHMTRSPPPLQQLAPTTPPALADLVHSMLAKQPGERPTMREVVGYLQSAEECSSPSLAPVGQVVSRRPAFTTLSGVASAIFLLAGLVLHLQAPLRRAAAGLPAPIFSTYTAAALRLQDEKSLDLIPPLRTADGPDLGLGPGPGIDHRRPPVPLPLPLPPHR